MFRIAFRLTRNIQDVEDAVQESFRKSFVNFQSFQEKSSFSTWLTRITINEALLCLRRARTRNRCSLMRSHQNTKADSTWKFPIHAKVLKTYSHDRREQVLSAAMRQLRPGLRIGLKLHLEERTIQETAKMMRIGIPTVKARLFRGKKQVRRLLKPHVRSMPKTANGKLQEAA